MNVAIRVDASLQIGSGHVMRCLTLAVELRHRGSDVFFICCECEGHLCELIEKKGFQVLRFKLGCSGARGIGDIDVQLDMEQSANFLKAGGLWDWLIVDHYALGREWETAMRSYVLKTLVIDDLADRRHDCDLLLDQNLYYAMQHRYKGLVPEGCRTLLGPSYALLRSEFRESRESLQEENRGIRRILVFFGGVDIDNFTAKTLKMITDSSFPDIFVDVVLGSTNPHRKEIETLCSYMPNVHVHIQTDRLADLMASADIAIGAGGSVSWERCCMGLPAIVLPIADNQEELIYRLADEAVILTPDSGVDSVMGSVKSLLTALMCCSSLLFAMKKRAKSLVDGRGVQRVVNCMMSSEVRLHAATCDDAEKLLEWRNHPDVRRYTPNPDLVIEKNKHTAWLKGVIDADHQVLLIAEDKMKKTLGVLRYDLDGDSADVSIYVVPGQFGLGWGGAVLLAGEYWLAEVHPEIETLHAVILDDNRASRKIFLSLGFVPTQASYVKRLKV